MFWKTDEPGEYRIVVSAAGKDADGQEVKGEASARFIVYQDEAELARRAANHDFLKRLAARGGRAGRGPGCGPTGGPTACRGSWQVSSCSSSPCSAWSGSCAAAGAWCNIGGPRSQRPRRARLLAWRARLRKRRE